MLSLFLASMEGTVVATAMPTIVAQLGGLDIYSWVFSMYMLTSTTTVPIYGKLSDLYGRKRIYAITMLLFLAGSVLCGTARTMEQLVLYRAIQGLGAGGVLPVVFTIVGELFDLEMRARLQGLFSGVWGISSIIGPLIGGFLVDQVSWPWVFTINVFPGLLALGLVWFAWQGESTHRKVSIDYPGAIFLTLGALALLLGLNEPGSAQSWAFFATAAVMFAGLVWAERRAVDPILPLDLFRDRLFLIAILHGVFAGWAMFGSLSFVPLFAQGVLGTSATQAGITLTPMSLAWTAASIYASRALLSVSYRTLSVIGGVLLATGMLLTATIDSNTSWVMLVLYLCLTGAGMGLSIPSFLIAVQSTVERRNLGIATSTVQFSRSIGGTIGVSILGLALTTLFAGGLRERGLDPSQVSVNALMDSAAGAASALAGPVREALSGAIAGLFWIAFVAAVVALVVTLLAPGGRISEIVEQRTAEAQRAKGAENGTELKSAD